MVGVEFIVLLGVGEVGWCRVIGGGGYSVV